MHQSSGSEGYTGKIRHRGTSERPLPSTPEECTSEPRGVSRLGLRKNCESVFDRVTVKKEEGNQLDNTGRVQVPSLHLRTTLLLFLNTGSN